MTFKLDPFQEEALEWIKKDHSLIISAPTGAGKTLVAEAAIERALSQKKRTIYTAPIKALSNQKFRDFKERFGEEKVGILTGDVQINANAEIVIMTTEIYRNCLFDNADRVQDVGWIIFDEIHYLDDPARGTVWEEAIMFTPKEICILALSATVPNVKQLADWMNTVQNRPIVVVEEKNRPVPLDFLFQCQGQLMNDLKTLKRHGYMNRDNWKLSSKEKRRGVRMPRSKPNRIDHLFEHILRLKRLPMIYFVFGRRRSEFLAWEINRFDFLKEAERKEITKLYGDLLKRYDLQDEKSAEDMWPLIEQGIAYHHAGMLPSLKEVIEQLFTSRLIKVIFTTETFALGINMPARCVAFDQLEKFYGTHFGFLTTRDFFQMAGRAGRRGMDECGYVYSRIQPQHVPHSVVERIITGQPEEIHSQLNSAYATMLNLYRSRGPALLEIYPSTFHYFQSHKRGRNEGRKQIENKLELLASMHYIVGYHPHQKHGHDTPIKSHEGDWGLTAKGEFAASLFGYELPLAEMHNDGMLENLDEDEINVLISALICEPRKGDQKPRLKPRHEKLRKKCQHYSRMIHKQESKYRIYPYTKPAHFNFAQAVEAWSKGASFDEVMKLTGADEGELVRHIRMIIQLLRELLHAPHTSEVLKVRARSARDLINRDVVDAEKQLRV